MFRERKFEVLFLYDPWDEFVMEHLRDFDGKTLRLAEKADLNIADAAKKEGALSRKTPPNPSPAVARKENPRRQGR